MTTMRATRVALWVLMFLQEEGFGSEFMAGQQKAGVRVNMSKPKGGLVKSCSGYVLRKVI